ncbi:MAG: hypothetical protein R3C49_04460 [Planctomycetaceae bacterium]
MSLPIEPVLNRVLIDMGRSFLQYISDAWPWVDPQAQNVQEQVFVLAARQRQDVGDLAAVLSDREFFIDFGTFPTEYTDLQFLALNSIFEWLHKGQADILGEIASGISQAQTAGDDEAVQVLTSVQGHEQNIAASLKELQSELQTVSA